jgi:hypothetical protein
MWKMVRPVFLTDDEKDLVIDVIELHEEGLMSAKDETTVDQSIPSVESLVDLTGGIEDELDSLERIRGKLSK